MVFAAGTTPLGLFAELRSRVASGAIDLTGVRPVQLDEYVGLERGDPRSLWDWLSRELLVPCRVDISAAIRFELDADADEACAAVERQLDAAGGIDLAVLGIGPNGHVGFNEPPSLPDSVTRLVRLDEASIVANARYWGSVADVPPEAVTLGLDRLIGARETVLLVSGAHKREILARVLEESPSPEVPASFLREGRLTVIADRAALP